MAKTPPNTPTKIGQRVQLRGRPLAKGEIVAWYDDENPAYILIVDKYYPLRRAVTVAWDWESYQHDIKGMAWGYIMTDELEVIENNTNVSK